MLHPCVSRATAVQLGIPLLSDVLVESLPEDLELVPIDNNVWYIMLS